MTADVAARPGAVVVSRHQLAGILGCHPDRISEYSHAGMPVLHQGGAGGDVQSRRNRYDAIACAQWVRRHRPGSLDAQTEKARRDHAQAELHELKLAERRNQLVSARDVELRWSARVVEARTHLLALPSRLKGRRPDLSAADLAAIDTLIREALEELADSKPKEAS